MTTTKPPSVSKSASGGDDGSTSGQSGTHRRMLGATAIIMFGVLLSRVLGLVRERVIAHQFGQGYHTDVYIAAFTIPDVLFYLIAGGALSSAFIPVFTEYMERGEVREAWRLFSLVAVATTLVVSAFILVGEVFAYPLVQAFNPGWHHAQIADTANLTRILLPAQICFFLGGLMMGALQVRGNNFGQAFGPAVYNLGIILGGMFLARRMGVAGLCWGAVGGAVIGNLVLQWILLRRVGGRFSTSIFRNWHHPGAKQVWNLMWPILLGLALPQVCPIINKLFASYLGKGAMSALIRANQLMQVPLGVFAQACAIAIFPTMAAQAAQRDRAGLRKTVNFGIRFILFLTVPSSIYMMVLALPIVQFLLQTGKFNAANAQLAASLLVFYSVGLFAWSAQAIVARGFYALKDSRTPVVIGTLVTVVFVIANALVLRILGTGEANSLRSASGLALVTSCAAILNTSILLVLLRRKLGGIEGGKLAVGSLKILAASAGFGLVCRLTYQFLLQHPLHKSVTIQSAETLLLSALAGTFVYAVLAFALRMEETKMLKRVFRRRPA